MPRSTCVHPDHKQAVALALARNGFLTQGDLAAHLAIALSTVSKFFRGLNVSVAKFEEISEALGLDTRELMQPKQSAPTAPDTNQAPARVNFYAYDDAWVGRATLVAELTARISGPCRLLLITGIAGVGKTALAERLSLELSELENADLNDPPTAPLPLSSTPPLPASSPPSLLRENFDAQNQSSDFGSFAARLLEKLGQVVTPSDRTEVQQLLARLIQALRTSRRLILIDSLEELLQGNEQEGWSEFKDDAFRHFFQQVLAAETFQSRLIVTSQELPSQLLALGTRYRNFWSNQPLTGLSETEQLALFEKTGLDVRPEAEGRSWLVRMGKAYEGHPLALRVITGEIGSRPFFGDVLAYWHRYGKEIETVEQAIAEAAAGQAVGAEDKWQLDRFTRTLRRNVRTRLEQTFQRLRQDARFAYILICEASVYRCAVPEDWWLSHLEYWDCDEATSAAAMDALKDRFLVEELIEVGQYSLRQHNLIRSVSLEHLKGLDQLV